MTPIFNNNIKKFEKPCLKRYGHFCHEKQYLPGKTLLNQIKWRNWLQVIKEIQISRHMTIYGQPLGHLNAKTMIVFVTEKKKSCIKSKLYFFLVMT